MTLEEVNSADKFVQNMDKIELPNQLAAVLADPLLQKLLVLRKDETTSRRVTRWIGAALADFLEGNSDTKSFVDMMDVLAEYVTRAKVCYSFLQLSFPADGNRKHPLSSSTSSSSCLRRGTASTPSPPSSVSCRLRH